MMNRIIYKLVRRECGQLVIRSMPIRVEFTLPHQEAFCRRRHSLVSVELGVTMRSISAMTEAHTKGLKCTCMIFKH